MSEVKPELRIATYMCPTHPVQLYELIMEFLEKKLDCYTTLQYESRGPGPLPDRPDPFSSDKIDIAFITAAAYMRLRSKKSSNIELLPVTPVFAHQMNVENKPGYFSDVIIHSDKKAHNVNTLLDLRGCTFAYNDEESLSGSKLVLKTLKAKGENASFFGSILSMLCFNDSRFLINYACPCKTEVVGSIPIGERQLSYRCPLGSGSHLASAQMVLSKQAEWATVDSTTLLNAKRFMHDGGKDIITLETLGRLPPYPVVVNSRLSAKIKNSISEALINLTQTAEWKKKFAKFGIIKYESNSDGAYDGPAAQVWAVPGENLNIRYY